MIGKTDIGRIGENLAAEFFENKGFEVAARNYRHKKAEIDLIVKKDNWLLFIEVKTRTSAAYGFPEQFLFPYQVNRIFDAAEEFIYHIDWQGHIRFDVVSIILSKEPVIEHFEDAIN